MSAPAAANRRSVIVFGAHPDDMEIGMAGTVRRLALAGHDVYSCIAVIPENRERRVEEARHAAAILGIKEVMLLPIDEKSFGYNRMTIGVIDSVIRSLAPHSVFTHWSEDSHQDHVNVTRCVIAATRKNDFNVYMYEQAIPGGITPAAFRAQFLVDVSAVIHEKMEGVRAHGSQMARNGEWWLEGIRGRAMYRGYQIRTQYAEAFEIVKINEDTNLFSCAGTALAAQAGADRLELVA